MRISVLGLGFGATCFAIAALAPLVPAGKIATLAVPAAFADEAPDQAIDFSQLVKIDEDYEIAHDDSVSMEIISRAVVRKIGAGRVSEVNILTTHSGTYSTDGLYSRHVLYPGIDVTRAENGAADSIGAIWKTGFGWMVLPVGMTGGTTVYGPVLGGGRYIAGKGRTCVTTRSFTTCS